MSIVKRITITNQTTEFFANFYDNQTYKSIYGSNLCEADYEENAILNRDFLRLFNNEIGFFGLPINNNNFQVGIDQNGQTFLNNYYSSRQLLWTFKQFPLAVNKLDQVFYQSDKLLDIEIETSSGGLFGVLATINGRYEDGNIELICTESFFEDKNNMIEDSFIIGVDGDPLIPSINGFKVNKVYFDVGSNSGTETINVNIFANPTFTISGVWETCTISNQTTGSILTIPTVCNTSCVIDCKELSVIVDSQDVTQIANGSYPTLVGGENIILITFETQNTDVTVNYSYNDQVGSVF